MKLKISMKALGKSMSIVGTVLALSPELYQYTFPGISPYILFERSQLLVFIGRVLFMFGMIIWMAGKERKMPWQ